MTRAYVLDPVTRATLGLVDQSWERLSYVRRYVAMDTFELAINRTRLWASELTVGRLLYLPDEGDLVFLIEQIASVAEGSTRNDEMTVTGRSLEGIAMAERLVKPPAGESHDRQTGVAAETAIKYYVRAHAADLAAPARAVPGLVVAADAVRGPTVTVNGRYQTVLDLVREIGLLAGLGWEITYDPGSGDFVFDVTVGVDRTASVFFDFAFETLERWEELDSVIDAKTVAVVAGQGEGTARDLVTRWSGAEPTGFDRREAFLDARDVEIGATTVLAQRGDAFLAATGAETSLEADVHQYGGFRYREHWDVGDIVTVRNAGRGISYAARIVEVETVFERSATAPTVTAVVDRPFPTMRERVEGSGARGGVVDYPVAAVPSGPAGGELTGSYPEPTVASIHAGSAHHARAHDHANAADGTALAPATVAISSTGSDALVIGADTNLYRSAANVLKTDDTMQAAGFEIGTNAYRMVQSGGLLGLLDVSAALGLKARGLLVSTSYTDPNPPDAGIQFGADVQIARAGADILRAEDAIRSRRSATTDEAFGAHESASTTLRWRVRADGLMEWAATSGSADVQLFRGAANVLRLADGDTLQLASLNLTGLTTNATFSINNGGTATFGSKSLSWARIGPWVFMRLSFTVTATGSGTSTVTITSTGLPESNGTPAIWGDRGGTGVVSIVGRGANVSGEMTISRIHATPSNTTVDGAGLVSGATYSFIGVYFTAAAF